jgi:hypothetical protein
MQYLVCSSNDLFITETGSPQCSVWVALTAPANEPDPVTMAVAFGAGLSIILPIFFALKSIRWCKQALFS